MSTLTIILIVVVSILGGLALLVGYACVRLSALLSQRDDEHRAEWHFLDTKEDRS